MSETKVESSSLFHEVRKYATKSTSFILGSTQSGKSSLINYLINPHNDGGPCVTGNNLDPTTIHPEYYEIKHTIDSTEARTIRDIKIRNEYTLNVIDTPGLEDTKDDENMISIYEKINGSSELSIPIMVHKFGKSFTESYHNILKVYKKMIPGLFDKGVMVIVTNFCMTDRNLKSLKKQKIDIDTWEAELVKNLNKSFGLNERPLIMYIDSYPVDDDEVKLCEVVRDFILTKMIKTPTIKVKTSLFLKPPSWTQLDKEWIGKCDSLLEGFREGIVNKKKELNENSLEQRGVMIELNVAKDDLLKVESYLTIHDNDNKIQVATWNTTKAWRFFLQTDKWDLRSDYDVTKVERIKHNHCVMKVISEGRHDVGEVTGILRGTYADVTLYTDSNVKFVKQIEQKKADEKNLREKVNYLNDRLAKIETRNHKFKDDLELISTKFRQTEKMRNKLIIEYLSIDDLHDRMLKKKDGLWEFDIVIDSE
jgi:GTPase SAR1 family protein